MSVVSPSSGAGVGAGAGAASAAANGATVRFVGFGEAMIRFAPTEAGGAEAMYGRGQPSGAATFTRTVGGDELNTMVALCKLGCVADWVSVLPETHTGRYVIGVAKDAGVGVGHIVTVPATNCGAFTVLPDEGRVLYERRHSAFAKQAYDTFSWDAILSPSQPGERVWLQATGITPMLGDGCWRNWMRMLEVAGAKGVDVSLDLNHRVALGPLGQLWEAVAPNLASIALIITSRVTLRALEALLNVKVPSDSTESVDDTTPADSPAWIALLKRVHLALGGPMLACCFKTRSGGTQRRWSVVVDATGAHSTAEHSVYHQPKDECGGGSAWTAGVIHALSQQGVAITRASHSDSPSGAKQFVTVGGVDLPCVARQGDALAALCQEVFGDHSTVTRSEFVAALTTGGAGTRLTMSKLSTGLGWATPPPTVSDASPAPPSSHALDSVVEAIGNARVVAILRAKNPDVAIARGKELVELGCTAMEVTVDTVEFPRVVRELVAAVGDRCCIGCGTAMTLDDIKLAAAVGCKFALSPVKPLCNFVQECHERGMLAVPAAFTPQEIYECHMAGAKLIKLFPAQMWLPANLKSVRSVGLFGDLRYIASGGISPDNAATWLDAGCFAVGMGSKLAGKDIGVPAAEPEKLAAAVRLWEDSGRDQARGVFEALAERD